MVKNTVVILVLILLGFLPCLFLMPICLLAFFVRATEVFSHLNFDWQMVTVLIFAPSGLIGIIFFLVTIADYGNKYSWSKVNYMFGLYALAGALIAIFMDRYQLKYFSTIIHFSDGTIIPYVCRYPIVALIIAYFTRYKTNPESLSL